MFFLKTLYWGQRGARENYSLQIRNIVEAGYRSLGEKPVIIGECGVPMDMKSVCPESLFLLLETHVHLAIQQESRIQHRRLDLADANDGCYDDWPRAVTCRLYVI